MDFLNYYYSRYIKDNKNLVCDFYNHTLNIFEINIFQSQYTIKSVVADQHIAK